MPRLGVVVPAFEPDVDRLMAYLGDLAATLEPAALRVEVDDPAESTVEALGALQIRGLEVSAVPYRRGKGAAVTAGFEALEADHLAFADADGSTAPSELGRVVERLATADLAVGSRRHPDATVLGHQTFARRFMGDAFARIARRALPVALYDYQCGAKAITADGWTAVRPHLYEPGFAWDVEFVAMAAAVGLDVAEVPIRWEDRPGSTVSPLRTALAMARTLHRTRDRARRVRGAPLGDVSVTREESTALVDREV